MTTYLPSPLGMLALEFEQEQLTKLYFVPEDATIPTSTQVPSEIEPRQITRVKEILKAYFQGKVPDFSCAMAPQGTPFQQKVWEELKNIPYGQTVTYQTLAQRLDQPEAVRAVASAVGKNPLWIIIPCHRVIRSNGGLGGYAGGLERKKRLLALESQSPLFSL